MDPLLISIAAFVGVVALVGAIVYVVRDLGSNRAEDRLEVLKRIHHLCNSSGIELVVIVPWYRDFDEHEALLRSFAAENDVTVVDLPRLLELPAGGRREYFRDPSHPTTAGHALMADALLTALGDRWKSE